jgi:hypothetical protein
LQEQALMKKFLHQGLRHWWRYVLPLMCTAFYYQSSI